MKDYSEIMEHAVGLHNENLNCAQCVLCTLKEYTGLDEATSKSVAAGFGGGMRSGEVCGSISGAIMAMGLATVKDGNGTKEAPIADKTKKFITHFKEDYGFVSCSELIRASGGSRRCNEFIGYCARLAAAIIDDDNVEINT